MAKFAQSSLQSSFAFAVTPSDSADLSADAGNTYKFPWAYIQVTGTSGNVVVTPVDGQSTYSIVTALGAVTGGSGYQSGTYTDVPLSVISGKQATTLYADLTITNGVVTAATYKSGGIGADTTSVWSFQTKNVPAQTGSGFQVATNTVNASATDKVTMYCAQGQVLGGNLPLMVRRVWSTSTTATNIVALVGRGGNI